MNREDMIKQAERLSLSASRLLRSERTGGPTLDHDELRDLQRNAETVAGICEALAEDVS